MTGEKGDKVTKCGSDEKWTWEPSMAVMKIGQAGSGCTECNFKKEIKNVSPKLCVCVHKNRIYMIKHFDTVPTDIHN